MHRIDTDTAQVDKFGAGKNGFTGGNPQTGELPTALDEDFFDALQEEISFVIESSGMSLVKGDNDQLLKAMDTLFASNRKFQPYNPLYAASIGGYPQASLIPASNYEGYWFNTVVKNMQAPEVTTTDVTGWVPVFFNGITLLTGLSSTDVTLTTLQAANERIFISGALTSNITITVPAWRKYWTVINGCSGEYTITFKTPFGKGIVYTSGKDGRIYANGTDVIDQGLLLTNNFLSEISSAGSTAQKTAIANLGLGSAATRVVGTGGNQIPDMTSWTGQIGNLVLGQPTWYKRPDGIIVQEGITLLTSSSMQVVKLPVTFPRAIIGICATKQSGYFTPVVQFNDGGSLSSFSLGCTDGSSYGKDPIFWRIEGV